MLGIPEYQLEPGRHSFLSGMEGSLVTLGQVSLLCVAMTSSGNLCLFIPNVCGVLAPAWVC